MVRTEPVRAGLGPVCMRTYLVLAGILLAPRVVGGQSRTPESILAAHAAAVGGSAWDSVRSRTTYGTIELGPPGAIGRFVLTETPERRLLVIDLPGGAQVREWFDGTKGGVQSPQGDVREEPAALQPAAGRERTLARDPRIAGYERILSIVTGDSLLAVEARSPEGAVDTMHFSPRTGLLASRATGMVTPRGPVRVRFEMDDYRRIGSWLVPFRVRQVRSDRTIVMQADSVRFNLRVDLSQFGPRR